MDINIYEVNINKVNYFHTNGIRLRNVNNTRDKCGQSMTEVAHLVFYLAFNQKVVTYANGKP